MSCNRELDFFPVNNFSYKFLTCFIFEPSQLSGSFPLSLEVTPWPLHPKVWGSSMYSIEEKNQ